MKETALTIAVWAVLLLPAIACVFLLGAIFGHKMTRRISERARWGDVVVPLRRSHGRG
jgi:hypothetical protein